MSCQQNKQSMSKNLGILQYNEYIFVFNFSNFPFEDSQIVLFLFVISNV